MFQAIENVSFILACLSVGVTGGWVASFIAFRKDERSIQLSQITEERKKWRKNMRKLSEDLAGFYIDNKTSASPKKVAKLRAMLAASINPKDVDDEAILEHYDNLFSGASENLSLFNRQIALLLKHDWERVKRECTPLYLKPFIRFTNKQRLWRAKNYRESGKSGSRER